QDSRFISNFVIYHQRYSTNTFPAWSLAQPFRILAHNGEINTISGNINWMRCHEIPLASEVLGDFVDDLKPIIAPSSSDSAALDNVAEILLRTNRELPEVKSLMIPEAWEKNDAMATAHRDFYKYANGIMEPWDGPAATCAYGGKWVLAGADRNGLRPLRYTITKDGLLIVGSETGMIKCAPKNILKLGRIGPGEMIAVDLQNKKLYHDRELKDYISSLRPYGQWTKNISFVCQSHQLPAEDFIFSDDKIFLRRAQILSGWSFEETELILQPMAQHAKEATGSMGDDSPAAMLSRQWSGMHLFFRQNFSQVTNPPIDSLRERHVMSLKTRLGNLGNILEENAKQLKIIELESPILLSSDFNRLKERLGDEVACLDCYFSHEKNLSDALHDLQKKAARIISKKASHLFLDNSRPSKNRFSIPMILAVGAIHTYLLKEGLRTFTTLNVCCLEALDTHHHAVLIGVGATTIYPILAEATIIDRKQNGLLKDIALEKALVNFRTAIENGVAKIMAKMGIAVLNSYRGGYNFEALGLSRSLVNRFFPGLITRISGIGITGIENKLRELHHQAWKDQNPTLSIGGFYRFRKSGEHHAWEGQAIHLLQEACTQDTYSLYQIYAKKLYAQPPTYLRDLLDFNVPSNSVAPEEVVSITEIRKRMIAPGISLGALSKPAHETLSIAMNRIGARSDSGEGGEDPERFKPYPNGDQPSSAIKQIASGRFGVTAQYLNACKEIEIKIAQGAKPGEGGQLPGFKVTSMIARLRHSTPGVTLISPPPHHDIYSIEDLAQLIYDLKQINDQAKICVKLVARAGIGAVAAGVAKAKADSILVSGHCGGTGASPQSSIKYAGLPWEMGLSETHQVLSLNHLREQVTLRVDGGIRTGRDIVIAAILGAEEYGIGTASLVAMGCIMVRQCHSNTCPVGVCTQDPDLIKRFQGTPEKVVNLFSFIAEEVREILSSLNVTCLEEIIGQTQYLKQVNRGKKYLDDLDLNPILIRAETPKKLAFHLDKPINQVAPSLDIRIIKDAAALFERGEKRQLQYNIRNTDRAIGTMVSSRITRQFGMDKLEPGHLHIRMRGTAGQSLGAFAVRGLTLEIFGDANDYVAKGLSGGDIVVRPLVDGPKDNAHHTIIGNTCLYGATAGTLFAAGTAGERFAVRNSGALSVIQGCGSNGCEYMTGGSVIILGNIGHNFAAGMTG
ncbi:MAG: glutamate synthase large subunit, partial [Pseudomonadota bacterium]